uniref:Murine leukemia virus integrase C-terminal domain-containing protein n=1 Tax=Crocodylus porosus TaxID=8502 RepID=A0A7M4E6T6_CROPO
LPPSHLSSLLPCHRKRPGNGGSVVNPVQPGDGVLIKVHQRKDCLQPRWKVPFQVLLTTPTAVKVAEVSVTAKTEVSPPTGQLLQIQQAKALRGTHPYPSPRRMCRED